MLFNSLFSEPVLECPVWIWEVQPALTNTTVCVCFFQNDNISGNWEKTASCIYLSISYLFLRVSFFFILATSVLFHKCVLIHKINLTWSTAVYFCTCQSDEINVCMLVIYSTVVEFVSLFCLCTYYMDGRGRCVGEWEVMYDKWLQLVFDRWGPVTVCKCVRQVHSVCMRVCENR